MITKGIAKYVYLDSTEKFNGEDTGKYTLTVSVDDKEAKALEKAAFSTTYDTVWCAGPSIEGVKSIRPVAQVVQELIEEFENS